MHPEADPNPQKEPSLFDGARARVPSFVRKTYRLGPSLALHRMAIGWDLIRVPLNVALAPAQIMLRLLGLVCRLMRMRRVAGWLSARSLVMGTTVTHTLEARILSDLLGLSIGSGRSLPTQIEGAPELSPYFSDLSPDERRARAKRAAMTLELYSGTRSAVAEMTTGILTVSLGAMVFGAWTPGTATIAPRLADILAYERAVDGFVLGRWAGQAWYSVFSVGASPGLIALTALVLVMIASLITTFAGILADPVQVATGIHRRRLHHLIDALEHDLTGENAKTFSGPEPYYARILDVIDLGTGVFRYFR